ncbi:Pollen_Ole_e_I domain-containing protein [Cephalotus follicularis]|uniref:Pollen_Ole_e_I domain-containing protein n=1 Tax=Cephalotus follicularis TaxID=3775 RepID=A0A1Q3DFW5_CEPFO|nr:Pollen_Ole_e_I domain-containing protein [Cephalotus follicularis]
MKILHVCFSLFLLFAASFCHGDTDTVEVVGIGECADCSQSNIKTSQAFSGLRVAIDCKPENGEFKTRGVGELDEEGKFKVSLPHDMINNDGKIKEECYAQLHSASATPCPVYNGLESSKIVYKSKTNEKHTLGLIGNLKFSPTTCTSILLDKKPFILPPPFPIFKTPFPKIPIFKKPFPPPFPKIPIFKKPLPPPFPIFEKPFPPPVPIYEKPLPPPVPIKKKPIKKKPLPPPKPVFKKPLPPPVPKIKKPLPPPKPVFKKPLPPPVPIFKKPLPPPVPVFKKPLPPPFPIFKKPLPPPFPIFKKPLPPPFPIFKKPLPPPFPTFKKPFTPPLLTTSSFTP